MPPLGGAPPGGVPPGASPFDDVLALVVDNGLVCVVLAVPVAGVAMGDVELWVATTCVVVVVASDVQAPNNTAALIKPHTA